MIKRRTALKLLAAPALMTVARRGFAKEKVTYAYLLDPAYDAVTWAMSNGKVTSDLIDVEARGLAIPQLIQATSAKQYDVIMTAVIALPPAAARGLELRYSPRPCSNRRPAKVPESGSKATQQSKTRKN